MLVTFYHLTNPTLWRFWANFKTSPLQSSPFRRIKKINLTLKLQLQSLHFSIPAIHVLLLKYFNESKNFVLVPSVLESSLPLCGRPNILLVNWWQLMTNVSVCTDSGMTGQVGSFQNTVVYLQAFPYLSSPLPSHSILMPFFAWSLTLIPCSLLLNRTEMLATFMVANSLFINVMKLTWGVNSSLITHEVSPCRV